MIEVKVQGLADLQRRLNELPREVKRGGIILRGLLEGAKLIRDDAKRRAPVLKDQDLQSFGKGRRRYQGTPWRRKGAIRAGIVAYKKGMVEGKLTAIVRVRSRGYIFAEKRYGGRRRTSNAALAGNPNYWWLVEFGTSRARAQPFMRPAFESMKFQALTRMRQAVAQEITATLARLGPPQTMRKAA